MKNRLISLLIGGILCLSMFNAYAVSETKKFADESGLVSGLGIMPPYEDGTFGAEDAMTRGEFAGIIYRLMKLNSVSDSSRYTDIADNAYKNEINVLTELGIFNGTSEDKFSPDERISGAGAVKTVLLAMNYKPYSNEYPSGYLMTAATLGFTDEIEYVGESGYITRAELAKLIYNGLTCSYETVYNKGYQSYEKTDSTVLEREYNIALIDGTVERNDITGLYTEGGLGENLIKIGDVTVSAPQCRDMLGQRVRLYYDKEEMTAVYADNTKNEILNISSDDADYRDGELSYYSGNSEKKIKLAKDYICIYNFKPVGFLTENYMPKNGTIELIDNDRDGKYDVVKVMDYTSYRVSSSDENRIYFRNSDGQYLDIENKNVINGGSGDISFAENDVISYISNGDTVLVIKSNDTVKGKVASVFERSGRHYVTINETEYLIVNDGNFNYSAGTDAEFYLDFMGGIADIKDNGTSLSVGYLRRIYYEQADNMLHALIYVSGNSSVQYPIAAQYSLDGKSVKTAGLNPDSASAEKLPAANQLVRFKLNNKNEISAIDTAEKGSGSGDDRLTLIYDGTAQFKIGSGNFGGKVFANSSTKLIDISGNRTVFSTKAYSTLQNDSIYTIKAYALSDDTLMSKYILTYNAGSGDSISNDTRIAVVKDMGKALNADDLEADNIVVLDDNTEKSFFISDKCEVENGKTEEIEPGDVIRYATDENGEISRIILYLHGKTGAVTGQNPSGDFISHFRTLYGTVSLKNDGIILIKNDALTEAHLAQSFRIYSVDLSGRKPKVSVGSVSDIYSEEEKGSEASRVFIQTRYGDPSTMVIYNN